MAENETITTESINEELSIKVIILKVKSLFTFLWEKWLIIFFCGLIGAGFGYLNAFMQKVKYTATLSFALEDERGGSGGLSGAMGLASTLGIDLGTGAGGAFTGANLIELMKSRTLIERSFLNPITVNNKQLSLADFYIEITEMNKSWQKDQHLKNLHFDLNAPRSSFTFQQDSIMGLLYSSVTGENGILKVNQKDKKISIINIDVISTNELFSKIFAESVATEVSKFYVDTKSKKAKSNVAILQKQADSIRNELNAAITGVASSNDNTFNLNLALNVKRTTSAKRQIDVQANTAILTQLVTNLEMAKVTLLKETPLIQIIDKPILPLKKVKSSKLKGLIFGGILGGTLIVILLIARRFFKTIMTD